MAENISKEERYAKLSVVRNALIEQIVASNFPDEENMSPEEMTAKNVVLESLSRAFTKQQGLSPLGEIAVYKTIYHPDTLNAQVASGVLKKDSPEYKMKYAIYKMAVETNEFLNKDLESYELKGEVREGETLNEAKTREMLDIFCAKVEGVTQSAVQSFAESGVTQETFDVVNKNMLGEQRESRAGEAIKELVYNVASGISKKDLPYANDTVVATITLFARSAQNDEQLLQVMERVTNNYEAYRLDAFRNSISTEEYLQKLAIANIISICYKAYNDPEYLATSAKNDISAELEKIDMACKKANKCKDIEIAKNAVLDSKKSFAFNYCMALQERYGIENLTEYFFNKYSANPKSVTEKDFLLYALQIVGNQGEEAIPKLEEIAKECGLSNNAVNAAKEVISFTKKEKNILSNEEHLKEAIDHGVFPYLEEVVDSKAHLSLKRSLSAHLGTATRLDAQREAEKENEVVKEEPLEKKRTKQTNLDAWGLRDDEWQYNPDGSIISEENLDILETAKAMATFLRTNIDNQYAREDIIGAIRELEDNCEIYKLSFLSEEEQLKYAYEKTNLFSKDKISGPFEELSDEQKDYMLNKAREAGVIYENSAEFRQAHLDMMKAKNEETLTNISALEDMYANIGTQDAVPGPTVDRIVSEEPDQDIDDVQDLNNSDAEVGDFPIDETAKTEENNNTEENVEQTQKEKKSKEKDDKKDKKKDYEKASGKEPAYVGSTKLRWFTAFMLLLCVVFAIAGAWPALAVAGVVVATSFGMDISYSLQEQKAKKQEREKMASEIGKEVEKAIDNSFEKVKNQQTETQTEQVVEKVKEPELTEEEKEQAIAEGMTALFGDDFVPEGQDKQSTLEDYGVEDLPPIAKEAEPADVEKAVEESNVEPVTESIPKPVDEKPKVTLDNFIAPEIVQEEPVVEEIPVDAPAEVPVEVEKGEDTEAVPEEVPVEVEKGEDAEAVPEEVPTETVKVPEPVAPSLNTKDAEVSDAPEDVSEVNAVHTHINKAINGAAPELEFERT